MATLVLTAAGSLIGGPVGGAVGALIGNRIDGAVLGKGRSGPRLGDLSVQTSSYGQDIPKLFGRMRVAGTVIWATDIREDRHRQSAGKGQPNVSTYSYSASFAVALSARPILGVGRIWADGRLLRGAAGDWKAPVAAMRLHAGGEDQPADPLIAAAEGIAGTPACRGLAYLVFEDLQLADFGNRIPSLTFEVTADEQPVAVTAIARAVSDGAIGGGAIGGGEGGGGEGAEGERVDGFAALGGSRRAAIESLATAFGLALCPGRDGPVLIGADASPRAIDPALLGTGAGERQPRIAIDRSGADRVPDEISIRYYDPARDWQAGLQRARSGGAATAGEAIEIAAALGADGAKARAEQRLAERRAARDTLTLRLPPGEIDLRPGDELVIDAAAGAAAGRWRITEWMLERMVLRCTAVRRPVARAVVAAAGSPGRAVAGADRPHGPTVLHLLDLPALDDRLATRPRLWLVAGGGAGWRGAAVSVSADAGASWSVLGPTPGPAVIGTATGVLGPGGAAIRDDISVLEVALLSDEDWLAGADGRAILGGANLALVGDELVQFARAVPLGGGRFRLSGLWRGRRGTEWAIAGHRAGERFMLIEPARMMAVELDAAAIGGEVRAMASGVGDPVPAEVAAVVAGHDVRPPSPVPLATERDGTAATVRWRRRSRLGWAWTDGGEVPLGEEAERYRVTLRGQDGAALVVAETAECRFTVGDRGSGAAAGWAEIEQLGTIAASLPARIALQEGAR